MFDEELYKKEIYEKYSKEKNIDEKFDNLNNNTYRKFPIVAIIAVLCISITTFAYNEISKNNKEINQKISNDYNTKIFDNNGWWNESGNGYYYSFLQTYDEYLDFKGECNDLIEVDETDFENNAILVIRIFGYETISNIYIDNDNLYIDMVRDYEKEENKGNGESTIKDRIISTEISKELKKDNVIIKSFPLDSNGFVPIQDLVNRDDYKPEDAIKDGYIVTQYDEEKMKTYLLSNNEANLDEFIRKTENGEEAKIRVVKFVNDCITFLDVIYYNNIYSTYEYFENVNNPSESYGHFESGVLITKNKSRIALDDETEYILHLKQDNGEYVGVCWICSFYEK